MLKKINIIFLTVILLSVAFDSYSQTSQCNLNIRFFDLYENGFLGGVRAKLTEIGNKKEFKSSKISDDFVFNGLNSGAYQVELSKKGYKKKVKKFSVDCSFVDISNRVFENIFLIKGNSKELITLDSINSKTAFAISDSDNSSNDKGVAFSVDKKSSPINQSAANLVKPIYPLAAKAVRAMGQVKVQTTIDEDGNVIQAQAVSGSELLHSAAIKAVRQSKFSPTLLTGVPVKVTGIMVYNFNPQ